MAQFDAKIFNPEVFGKCVERVPNLRRNELIGAGVFNVRNDLKTMLAEQTGGNYITIPMKGLIDGTPLNYDGSTDITATGTKTYSQSMVVVGRAKAWTEKDFSYDITGVDFMDNIAQQVAGYWDTVDQDMLLSILDGIFSMTGAENLKFVNGHTVDATEETETTFTGATLNSAMQKACGDNKGIFSLIIMHSVVATNLENLNLIQNLKYTDAQGITRDLGLGTLNGRRIIIDDSMPVQSKTVGTSPNQETFDVYTSYVLGAGAFDFCDCGAKTPYEMERDPGTAGGLDVLYTRQRKLYAPKGISFTKSSMAGLSPTDAELKTGANWSLVHDGASGSKTYIDHRSIPIARILTRG